MLPQVSFDSSGTYLCYGSPLGIKIMNIRANTLVKVLGKNENMRFVKVALFQGKAQRQSRNQGGTFNVNAKSA